MLTYDFSISQYDSCVYFRELLDGSLVYLLIYVDNILIATKNMFEINNLKAQLSGEFEMKDLVAEKNILVMKIRRNKKVGKLYFS